MNDTNPLKKIKLTNPIHFLAVGLGSGLSPKAPGTFGSIAAIPLWLLFYQLPEIEYGILLILTSVLGIYLCDKTAKAMGVHDHGSIVFDEFVGMWITLWLIPSFHWGWILAAFLFFRFFDILKPWPIGWFDKKVDGGVGIMIDDIWAGIFAATCLWATGNLWSYFMT
ncbi:phosphatidylglycerophosphatase A [Thorsellia kenyensis]|uniref:Phosphatidylglycerophosphatase A n=1 Tax=Thorsellia kenyensis TaxID=1549888 RepID=A0ABV6C9U0_9GAMM